MRTQWKLFITLAAFQLQVEAKKTIIPNRGINDHNINIFNRKPRLINYLNGKYQLILPLCLLLFAWNLPTLHAMDAPQDSLRYHYAYSSDDFIQDRDDVAGSAMVLAVFDYAGLNDRIVHFHVNTNFDGTPKHASEHRESVLETWLGGDDITVLECVEIDKVVADFPVGFSYLVDNERHYAGYYNQNRQFTVAARDPKTGIWTCNALPERVGWDSHNSIVMAADSIGCLHVSGNMHAVPLVYYRMDTPGDIQTLRKHFPIVDEQNEMRCTYPRFMKDQQGRLIFHYRRGGSGNGEEFFNRYNETSRRWQSLLGTPLFDGQGRKSAYRQGPSFRTDGNYHIVWVWRETPDCQTNHELSYVRSSDLKNWQAVTGEAVTLPLKAGDPALIVDPIPIKGGVINGGFRLTLDRSNRPCIAYHKYDLSGISQVFVALWKDNRWLIRQVSDWDYRWGFSGNGSINSHISINTLKCNDEGRMEIHYQHIKKGSGILIVDSETGAFIEERPANKKTQAKRYPDRLKKVVSDVPGMSVRWSDFKRDPKDPTISYALRWEANPNKNRLNEGPEIPIPPSTIKWYKFKNR